MNTALHRRTIVLWVLGLVAALVLAGAGAASAQTPITKTQVEPYKDVWVELGPCRDEPYEWTVTGRSVWHVTAAGIDENGDYIPPFRIHSSGGLGRVVAVPVDGSGTTYTGHFMSGPETIIVKQYPPFIGTYVFHETDILKGSDGSRQYYRHLVVFHVNQNLKVTSDRDIEMYRGC